MKVKVTNIFLNSNKENTLFFLKTIFFNLSNPNKYADFKPFGQVLIRTPQDYQALYVFV